MTNRAIEYGYVIPVLAALLAVAIGPRAIATPRDAGRAPAPADPIAWRLEGAPTTPVAMAQRAAFRLWIVAQNTGTHAVDTGRDRLEFRVNGRASMELALAFGNGGREARWGLLPAGDTVREPRDMGETLFPAPGAYEIALARAGVVVARLRVTVVP